MGRLLGIGHSGGTQLDDTGRLLTCVQAALAEQADRLSPAIRTGAHRTRAREPSVGVPGVELPDAEVPRALDRGV